MFSSRALPIRRTAISFAIALTAMLTACEDTITSPAVSAPVSTVQVVGSSDPLTAGDERTLTVRLRDVDGTVLTGRSVTWTSSDVSVATVTAAGRVTALSAGTATILARSEGRQGSLHIVVQAAPVASILLSETHVTLVRHSSRQVQATARDGYGRPVLNASLDWISDDPSVARVSSSGHVTAWASGTTRIIARVGGVESSLTVTVPVSIAEVRVTPGANVMSVGTTHAYTAQVLDDRGQIMLGQPVVWSSSTPTVASVSSSGEVRAIGRGYATITARVGAVSGSVALTVTSNDWRYESNLFHSPVVVKSDTTSRSQHLLVIDESRLVSAAFRYSTVTKLWTMSAELVHYERSEFQGNVMWRETGRQTVYDRGTGTEYDLWTGAILLRTAYGNAIQFRFTPGQDQGTLRGAIRGFPLEAVIPMQR